MKEWLKRRQQRKHCVERTGVMPMCQWSSHHWKYKTKNIKQRKMFQLTRATAWYNELSHLMINSCTNNNQKQTNCKQDTHTFCSTIRSATLGLQRPSEVHPKVLHPSKFKSVNTTSCTGGSLPAARHPSMTKMALPSPQLQSHYDTLSQKPRGGGIRVFIPVSDLSFPGIGNGKMLFPGIPGIPKMQWVTQWVVSALSFHCVDAVNALHVFVQPFCRTASRLQGGRT